MEVCDQAGGQLTSLLQFIKVRLLIRHANDSAMCKGQEKRVDNLGSSQTEVQTHNISFAVHKS